MAKQDEKYLITTEELTKLVNFKKSKIRIYVSQHKIFIPIASHPEDKRKHLFDRRCCLIRKDLFDYIPPYSGITVEKAGQYINEICGKTDKKLLYELNAGKTIEEVTEEKLKELDKLISDRSKQANLQNNHK